MFNWDNDTTIKNAVCQALGAASVCWEHPEGAGEFNPDQCVAIANELCKFIGETYAHLS